MIKVTWEWLGQAPALDLADTVTVEDGSEHDLVASLDDYERWARVEAGFLPDALAGALGPGRVRLMGLRTAVRGVLAGAAAGTRPPRAAISELNTASRASPEWVELDADLLGMREMRAGQAIDRLLAWYARSAIEVVADEGKRLRRCPAPSCGMFYLSSRPDRRWCSTQCGTRARVARHYEMRRHARQAESAQTSA
jgi:predicted RNA-binding Zn ribbon-like protein